MSTDKMTVTKTRVCQYQAAIGGSQSLLEVTTIKLVFMLEKAPRLRGSGSSDLYIRQVSVIEYSHKGFRYERG